MAEIEAASDVFDHAIDLAEKNNARLTAIIVAEPLRLYRYLGARARQLVLRERMLKTHVSLERLIERACGRVNLQTTFAEDKPFLAIIRDVLRNKRDLVIKMAGRTSNHVDRLLGTTDMHLLRKCPCPVWFIKADTNLLRHSVMACVDFDEENGPIENAMDPLNQTILEVASSLAVQGSGECQVVHAWDAVGEDLMRSPSAGLSTEEIAEYVIAVQTQHRRRLEQLVTSTATSPLHSDLENVVSLRTPISLQSHILRGPPQEVIPTLASDLNVDVLVMGTVARSGVPGLLIGNTAEGILNRIDCSVFAVKPPGFRSPVLAGR